MPLDPYRVETTISKEKAAPVIAAVVDVLESWNITDQNAADLLDISVSTWRRMRTRLQSGRIGKDMYARMNAIFSINKSLWELRRHTDWLHYRLSLNIVPGRSPIEFMGEAGLLALLHVDTTLRLELKNRKTGKT